MAIAAALAAFISLGSTARGQLPSVHDIPPETQDYVETPRSSGPDQIASILRFPSPISTKVQENNTVEAEIYLPRDVRSRVPCVILLHFWGATDLAIVQSLARQLNRNGIGAAVMVLPYHLRRSPPGVRSGELALQADVNHLRESMTQAVLDVKRLYAWLSRHPAIDGSKIGVAGISLGGVVASLCFGVDDRLSSGAFVLAGGDLAHLIWNSSVTLEARLDFRRQGVTEDDLRRELADVEPLEHVRQAAGENVLIIAAKFDEVVPPEDTKKLAEAYPSSRVVTLDSGHYGAVFAENRIHRTVADFFRSEFFGAPYTPPSSLRTPTIRVGVHYDPETDVTLGVGIDLFRMKRQPSPFVAGLLTPRGPILYGGVEISNGLSVGVAATTERATWGILWSIVL